MKTYIIPAVLCIALLVFFASAGYGQGRITPESGELPEYSVDRQGPIGAHGWQENPSTPSYSCPGDPGESDPRENRPVGSNGENIRTVVPIRLGNYDLLFMHYIGK